MFVAHVVIGKGHKLTQNSPKLTSAPNGCDSVLGEVGADLNHDEVVTYHDDSAIPYYVILYKR